MKPFKGFANRIILLAGIGVLCLFQSCVKDVIDMNKISNTVDWNPKFGFPVAYSNLSLKDIIESFDKNGLIKEDSVTKILYLQYTSLLLSKRAEDLITIPPQNYQEIFNGTNIPAFPPVTPDTVSYKHNSNYTFNFTNGEQIDSVRFKAGTISFHVQSEFQHTGRVWITMPTFLKNGKPLNLLIPVNKSDGSFDITLDTDLNGYDLGLNPVNQIPFTYLVVLDRNSGQPILATQKVTIDVQIQNAMFQSLFGYIGNYAILPTTTDKISIGLFDSYNSLNVEFSDPRIELDISNSFGAPVQVQLSNVQTWSAKNKHFYPINFTSGNPFIIKAPLLSQLGDTVTTVVQFDKSNSNIFGAIPDVPQYIEYTVGATSNPAGKTAASNFVLDTSKIDVNFNLDLPFNLKASNIQHFDTIPFDFSSMGIDFSIVKEIALYNTYTNSIPFDLNLLIILKDDNQVSVDTLYKAAVQPLIRSGKWDAATSRYIVDPNAPSISPVIFDQARAQNLKKVKSAIICVSLTTVDNGQTYAAFLADYRLQIAFQIETDLAIRSLNQL